MGNVRIGTASWTDKTLLASGWYPAEATTPAARLGHYASRFDLVEVDATYYHPPSERTAGLWAERTPDGFLFDIKAFSLLTGHPTRPEALYADLRPRIDKRYVYPDDLPRRTYEQVWERFLSALDPLVAAGKLGVVLFQFPPWFTRSAARRQTVLEVAARCRPLPVAIEFRHSSWFAADAARGTFDFLRTHELPLVCVDMPQGHPSSVPPLAEVTADLAVVRFHGRSDRWTSRDIEEKYRYRYREEELREWVPRLRTLAGQARETHVLMNNCAGDNAQRNAAQLADLLAGSAATC
ncbi:DUF72 domain-containing protein [Micromonospora echinofusca]|uniref:DUF72 domain-containing protein n=1 Tax=Micromonospora echinofusca TaxID=47858 RepID=A0ABS3VN73_MICEH|nr:DUF72 domain-containing protein [Micromonospora echinofusca]MBO4205989.1 DUF72 domain-containing protein [Micromonospora echinofusca]